MIEVPYGYGFVGPNRGEARGPRRYMEAGADRLLRSMGFEVSTETLERRTQTGDILPAVVDGSRCLATSVFHSSETGEFPIVLSGGCSACLGILSGLSANVGIIWFDAHGDFNTPETSRSGFFDGMSLAVATGFCYRNLWYQVTSAPPVAPAKTLLAGVRDLDPGERENVDRSGLLVVTASQIKTPGVREAFIGTLEDLRARVSEIYLHLDIDVLDPEFAPAVDYPTPNGLTVEEVEDAFQLIATKFLIRAAALTAYNPDRSGDELTVACGLRVLLALAQAASQKRNNS